MSEHAVSAVLFREKGNKQLQIFYVSKALLDAETRYSPLEKLALALIVAARKLRPYFQAHPIVAEFSPDLRQPWSRRYASKARLRKKESGSYTLMDPVTSEELE